MLAGLRDCFCMLIRFVPGPGASFVYTNATPGHFKQPLSDGGNDTHKWRGGRGVREGFLGPVDS